MLQEHKYHIGLIEAIKRRGHFLNDDLNFNGADYLAIQEKLKRYEASLILKEKEKEQERKEKMQVIKERDVYHKLVDEK